MYPGELIVRGTIATSMSRHRAVFDLYGTSGAIIMHFRMDFRGNGQPHRLVLNSYKGGWYSEIYGSHPFHAGQTIEVRARRIGDYFHLTYGNGSFLKMFPNRVPSSYETTSFLTWGDWIVHNIEMICKNPPPGYKGNDDDC
ncbi:unnamed protein product [Caenorhabditis bovis]|uniref:Galectin n=1 Tax=Caenorhabditis bovis TaxID=2654633 RepID=A0A8S1EM67_9PELO|nr:unnamed protein product [Caenorhabditis bovis]